MTPTNADRVYVMARAILVANRIVGMEPCWER